MVRYLSVLWVDRCLGRSEFPWGIFLVNVVGCYLIGLMFGIGESLRPLSEELKLGLVTGFLGSLTTFSTYGLQGLGLFQQGRMGLGIAYVGGSVVLGLLAVQVGLWSVNLVRV